MLVDSHCHLDCLDLTEYQGELAAALTAARAQDVGHFLCVCIDLEHFPNVLRVAEDYDDVTASVGVHPNVAAEQTPSVDRLLKLAKHPKIVAVGETGLDYYRQQGDVTWQQQRFRLHIAAARELNKPLIIHTRDAEQDTLQIMREEHAEQVGGVMHCFTGSRAMAEQCMDLGFCISFSGIVTFKNATDLQELVTHIPSDQLLIETDSPYLAPVPYRGKANQPLYVRYVAEKIAELRQMPIEEIAKHTTENFFRLFKQS